MSVLERVPGMTPGLHISSKNDGGHRTLCPSITRGAECGLAYSSSPKRWPVSFGKTVGGLFLLGDEVRKSCDTILNLVGSSSSLSGRVLRIIIPARDETSFVQKSSCPNGLPVRSWCRNITEVSIRTLRGKKYPLPTISSLRHTVR